jgi:1,4-alpha-glucan branching enzyme
MTAIPIETRKELAQRASNGIEVTLFWRKPTTRVTIEVSDVRLGESFEFEVDGSKALDAFHHPYAYAASPRAETRTRVARTDEFSRVGPVRRRRITNPLEGLGSW